MNQSEIIDHLPGTLGSVVKGLIYTVTASIVLPVFEIRQWTLIGMTVVPLANQIRTSSTFLDTAVQVQASDELANMPNTRPSLHQVRMRS